MAETTTFEAAAFTALGTPRDRVSLPVDLFDGTVNMPVMHRVVKAYMANQREGNASTKTRGLVIGGNQKPWRQKGTGRARQGSIRSPLWPGGGTVFGPTPRSYDDRTPRKMRALARKSALNARALENAILIIDQFRYEQPRTKALVGLLERLEVADLKVLVLTDGIKTNVYLSGRNLPNVLVMPYRDVSTYHLLWSDVVLIEGPAIGHTLEPVAEKEAPTRSTRRREPSAEGADEGEPKKKAKTKRAAAPAAKAPAKKPAARAAPKPAAKKAAAKAAPKKTAATKKKKGK